MLQRHTSPSKPLSSVIIPLLNKASKLRRTLLPPDKLVTAGLVVLWFATAIVGTIVNKVVMTSFPFPITFSIVHLVVGGIFDYMILRKRKAQFSFCMGQLRSCFLNGLFFGLSKALTYLAYELVPVSLAHTVKSAGPVFSVLTTNLWMQQIVPYTEILTLFPIVVGVTLSSVSELNFNFLGFVAAFCATLLGVLQTTSGKIVMTRVKNSDPIQLHFYAAVTACWLLLPLAGLFEMKEISKRAFAAVPAPPTGGLSLLSLPEPATPNDLTIPYGLIATSTLVLYVQSMASLHVLERVTTVSHNVTNTLKRFFIIVFSVMFFKNNIGIWNVLGILMAMSGFLSYAYVHAKNKEQARQVQRTHYSELQRTHQDKLSGSEGEAQDLENG